MFLLKNCSPGKELSNDVLIFRFNENFGLFYWNGFLKRIKQEHKAGNARLKRKKERVELTKLNN